MGTVAPPVDVHVCARLVAVSEPFNAGRSVECKLKLEACHGIQGGDVRLRMDVDAGRRYMVGDEFMLHLRLI